MGLHAAYHDRRGPEPDADLSRVRDISPLIAIEHRGRVSTGNMLAVVIVRCDIWRVAIVLRAHQWWVDLVVGCKTDTCAPRVVARIVSIERPLRWRRSFGLMAALLDPSDLDDSREAELLLDRCACPLIVPACFSPHQFMQVSPCLQCALCR
jgi:hypothetical protein